MKIPDRISSMKIRTRMLLLFGVSMSLVMLLWLIVNLAGIPFVGIRGEYAKSVSAAVDSLSMVADYQKNTFSHWFDERLGDTRLLASNGMVKDLLKGASNPGSGAIGAAGKERTLTGISGASTRLSGLALFLEQVRNSYPVYSDIEVIQSGTWRILASLIEEKRGIKSAYAEQLAAMDTMSDYPMIFFSGSDTKGHHDLLFAQAVRSDDSPKADGFVLLKVHMGAFVEQMLTSGAILGETGEIYLIDLQQILLTPLKYKLADGSQAEPLKFKAKSLHAIYAGWGVDSMVEADDYRGVPVVAFVRHLRVTPEFAISMIVKRDRGDLYAPANRNLKVSLGISAVAVLLMVALVLMLSRQLALPLERLSSIALRIRQGDLTARADGFKGFEANNMAVSFNAMADQLHQSQLELERRVEERTRELAESRWFLQNVLDNASAVIYLKDLEGRYLYINRLFEELFRISRAEIVTKTDFEVFAEEHARRFRENDEQVIDRKVVITLDEVARHSDGTDHHYISCKFPMFDGKGEIFAVGGISTDITEKKVLEQERLALEAQLQQARKLEAIGRLAGGVAHDFNNMLTVILGHADLGLMKLKEDNPAHQDLLAIAKSAERSADLTRQLLAFARKQIIIPRVLDLNVTVNAMLNMLRRLIGEEISLNWRPSPDIWPVKIDPSQLDQMLVNLCVNARDAIGGTGVITIACENIHVDPLYCGQHADAVPGDFVRLAISDSGKGMDSETLANIFEPFFTTKELGHGTGLGLATVYGAVRQNNGFISVYSEVGHGSTFAIHLPRHAVPAIGQEKESAPPLLHGNETIMLVEDEAAIWEISRKMLERLGYTIIGSTNPLEAIKLAQTHAGPIHLLVTDVIMPELNGSELAERLSVDHPEMKRLFMSGYTADIIGRHGVIQDTMDFIQKPYTLEKLSRKIRDVLGNG